MATPIHHPTGACHYRPKFFPCEEQRPCLLSVRQSRGPQPDAGVCPVEHVLHGHGVVLGKVA